MMKRLMCQVHFFQIKAIDLIEDGCVAVAVAVCIGDPHRGY